MLLSGFSEDVIQAIIMSQRFSLQVKKEEKNIVFINFNPWKLKVGSESQGRFFLASA